MNPRVSRSSALASKATGFPIAKIAAKLAAGLPPRGDPERHHEEDAGELRADDRLRRREDPAVRVREVPRCPPRARDEDAVDRRGDGDRPHVRRGAAEGDPVARVGTHAASTATPASSDSRPTSTSCSKRWRTPTPDRIFQVEAALRAGATVEQVYEASGDRPVVPGPHRRDHRDAPRRSRPARRRRDEAKRLGFSRRADRLPHRPHRGARSARSARISPVYKGVDTCAAEFEAYTPYYYSTYEEEDEAAPNPGNSVMILGSGPNRIGQGIEFDYCCVHAAFALQEIGLDAVMVNCNPETVSTDYDTSTRLYFEPLTLEDVLHIVETEQPKGVIVQLGGQTPLGLALALEAAGVPILGTPPDAIDAAEDRGRFGDVLAKLGIPHPPYGTATSYDEAREICDRIGYPVLVRPSYVLGGRAMEIVYSDEMLERYITTATVATPDRPILVDKFLEDAVEVDVDAIYDGDGAARRRDPRAHRRGRRALRRLGVRDAAAHAAARARSTRSSGTPRSWRASSACAG